MSRRPKRTARRTQSRRLNLEMLEVRELLTGFTVTTVADNGNNANPTPGSLRAAIVAADSDPTMAGSRSTSPSRHRGPDDQRAHLVAGDHPGDRDRRRHAAGLHSQQLPRS